MLTGQLPFRSGDRETLLEMQRTMPATPPSSIRKDCNPVAERIVLRLLEKDVRKRYRDGHHVLEELKALQRSLPSVSWDKESGEAPAPAPPPPPPPRSPGVTEWAHRAGLFARMLTRVYPNANAPQEATQALRVLWDLAAKATGLEGEIASHTRKLEALERRGRALRAEIGRKVEELAQEESRAMREAARFAEEQDQVRLEVSRAERDALISRQAADRAEQMQRGSRAVYEAAGAAQATLAAKLELVEATEGKRAEREAKARSLRQQIEDLRGQLGRYAEALDEDLSSGRERVAIRAREGVRYEGTFQEASNTLLGLLRGKAECQDLLDELTGDDSKRESAAAQS